MKIFGIVVGCVIGAFAILMVIGLAVATPETDAAHAAKAAVEAQLRDANSADFRNIAVYHPTGGAITVCGEVDGANAFGGLAGFTRFFYLNGAAIIETSDAKAGFDDLWSAAGCDGSRGLPTTRL